FFFFFFFSFFLSLLFSFFSFFFYFIIIIRRNVFCFFFFSFFFFFLLVFRPLFVLRSDKFVLRKVRLWCITGMLVMFAPFFIFIFGPLLQYNILVGSIVGG
ncbi:MFS transporter, partial [Escherichia coli]|uniref:MFS transporter n=1 Tax=Escherichia coli TaxID=562 RepID=UPI0010CC1F85